MTSTYFTYLEKIKVKNGKFSVDQDTFEDAENEYEKRLEEKKQILIIQNI